MVVTADELPPDPLLEEDSPLLEELGDEDSLLLEEVGEEDSPLLGEVVPEEPLPVEELPEEDSVPLEDEAAELLGGDAALDLLLELLDLAEPAGAAALRLAAAVRAGSWPEASCT